jgi:hypothetical protein
MAVVVVLTGVVTHVWVLTAVVVAVVGVRKGLGAHCVC